MEHPRSLVFLRIPKSGGATMLSIVKRQYPQHAVCSLDARRVHEAAEAFKARPEAERHRVRVLQGHMQFGLHAYLAQPSTYITVLRNPVERVISHYYYVCRKPSHYLHDAVMKQRMSLETYVRSGITNEVNDGQTRDLSGTMLTVPFGATTAEHLDLAQRRLDESFSVVGLAERFDETLMLLKSTFGWGYPVYVRHNVTEHRPERRALPQSAIAAIEASNRLDLALYAGARERFQTIVRAQPEKFHRELATLRRLNRAATLAYPVYRSLRSLSPRRAA